MVHFSANIFLWWIYLLILPKHPLPPCSQSSLFFFNFYFYFILLYNTVLVLPYIDMNQPWVYMSSQSNPTYLIKVNIIKKEAEAHTWLVSRFAPLYQDFPNCPFWENAFLGKVSKYGRKKRFFSQKVWEMTDMKIPWWKFKKHVSQWQSLRSQSGGGCSLLNFDTDLWGSFDSQSFY